MKTVEDIDAYLQKVINKAPVQARFKRETRRSFKIKDGRGRRKPAATGDYITMPAYGRTQWVALHEFAHVITIRRHGMATAGHGWQFAAIYLDLVRFGMGVEAHRMLKESFKAHKVRWTPKRTRTASPEALERLAKARAEMAARRKGHTTGAV
ncbi:hypothetical protein HOU03_gp476 [Caulobacter phage CcrSC]|uniref:SprT-like domain-containing protein n=1 Tax=Caulobacter phage CcrSC TaxID=2283272 RepID=A0A385ED50_9CAUD|nr:hypothetical protein HOU03_gp476 [Caulobacter phage CcrSC]AXQ69791.1 hypothetical protein CcrSC_gp209 [Caulobacter phage CcrSC]